MLMLLVTDMLLVKQVSLIICHNSDKGLSTCLTLPLPPWQARHNVTVHGLLEGSHASESCCVDKLRMLCCTAVLALFIASWLSHHWHVQAASSSILALASKL